MAAARQKEMKVSITELATTIRTLLGEPGGIACEPADISQDSSQRSFARSCLPNDEFTLGSPERQRKPRGRMPHEIWVNTGCLSRSLPAFSECTGMGTSV